MDAPTPTIDATTVPAAATVTPDGLPNFTHQQIVGVLTGILLCILLAAIDQTVVVPAVPAIAADLNGFGHLSWIVSAYLLTSTAATPIYGKLSDIYGRRALLMPAIVLFVIASVLCALSQTLFQLILFRALQGVGGGGLMAMSQAVIADVVAPRERGRYQGYMAGTWGVASISGPILGGWMTDSLSWHWIFWLNLPLGIGAMVLSHRALGLLKRPRRQAVRIDYIGAALLTGFITSCLLVMSWGGAEYAWDSPPVLGLGTAAAVLLVGLIAQERRAPDPLLPPRLFTNSVFSLGVLIAFLASAAMFGVTFLLPLFFQLVHGADASASGTLMVPFLAVNTFGAFVSGRMARRLGRAKAVVLCGLAAATLGFLPMAAMGTETGELVVISIMSLAGFGIGVSSPSSLMIVQNAAERRDVGSATGALLFLRSMGSAFGSTLVGALLAGRFADRLVTAGVNVPIDLGALRGGSAALAQLGPAQRIAARAALESGFHLAFLFCAALTAIAFVACVAMRDLPLQSSAK